MEDIFYAIWKATSQYGENTMQGWTGCSKLSTNSTTTLTDARDNNTYTVAKLKDGKCWMTQNLRIQNKTINSTNSDMSSGSYTIPASSSSYNLTSDFTPHVLIKNNPTLYGAYYSWIVATAGYTGETNAPNSICPKGWHLPSSSEQTLLKNNYSGTNIFQNPASFTLPGESYGNNGFTNEGITAWYWNKDYISCMSMGNGGISGVCNTKKCCGTSNYYGWSIRCINT